MNLRSMHQEVQVTLAGKSGALVTMGEFRSALLSAVRRINAEAEKPNEMILVANTGSDLTIEAMDDYNIEDEPDTIGGGGIYSLLEFDAVTKCITLPLDWVKVLAIYQNGEKMRPVAYGTLADGYVEHYHNLGNKIWLNIDPTADNFEVVLKIRRNYQIPLITDETYTGMPEDTYQLIFIACCLSLLQRPRYYNAGMINDYKEMYLSLLSAFSVTNISREIPSAESLNFTYNP
jgi:hypothetical protein